jgi:hypothetical protein
MSERTLSARQSIYRRSLKALTAALVVGATCFAVFASGNPGNAAAEKGGNGLPANVEQMKEAFEAYIQSIEAMAESFSEAEAFTLDEAHSVGAYDLITAFIHSANRNNLTSSGSGRRGYPRFAGFDDPDTRIGVDNPDTQYMGTIVINPDCQGIWRIWGNRTNTVDFILTTFDTGSGTQAAQSFATPRGKTGSSSSPPKRSRSRVVRACATGRPKRRVRFTSSALAPRVSRLLRSAPK